MAITNPEGRVVLRYIRNSVVTFQEIAAADLRTTIEMLRGLNVDLATVNAFVPGVLDIETRLVIKLNDVEV